jgi:DNA gyrase inhibitor GyrI
MKILYAVNQKLPRHSVSSSPALPGPVSIQTVKKGPVKGIYRIAPFDDPEKIQCAFQELNRIARTRDWITVKPIFYGILTPHQRNTYKAFLPLTPEDPASNQFPLTEIKSGMFATFTVRGDIKQTNRAVHYFYHQWLPESGYKIAHVTGFETFCENPVSTCYHQLERKIHIPIEPAV